MVPKGAPIKAMGIMDAWKRGRIIYAYLIWVVFKATTAGGLYGEYIYIRLSNIFKISAYTLSLNLVRNIATSCILRLKIEIQRYMRS